VVQNGLNLDGLLAAKALIQKAASVKESHKALAAMSKLWEVGSSLAMLPG
jgi:hypothetical protein